MDRIESKSIGFFLPAFTDELVDREAAESLEPLCEVTSSDEVPEGST
jgi:hypothetical protein